MEQPSFNNDINYVPSFVDIEGLQGVNSSQGMDYLENDNMNPVIDNNMQMPYGQYPNGMEPGTNPMMGMGPMPNMGCMDPMMGIDPNQMMPGNTNNMPPMANYPQSIAGVMSCMANMCYMTSILLMQMVNEGYFTAPPMGTNCGNNMY